MQATPHAFAVNGCINCGEEDDGGYVTGFEGDSNEGAVGPFCSQCWEFLREHFARASVVEPVAEPLREPLLGDDLRVARRLVPPRAPQQPQDDERHQGDDDAGGEHERTIARGAFE
jgi:hypothetical protein